MREAPASTPLPYMLASERSPVEGTAPSGIVQPQRTAIRLKRRLAPSLPDSTSQQEINQQRRQQTTSARFGEEENASTTPLLLKGGDRHQRDRHPRRRPSKCRPFKRRRRAAKPKVYMPSPAVKSAPTYDTAERQSQEQNGADMMSRISIQWRRNEQMDSLITSPPSLSKLTKK